MAKGAGNKLTKLKSVLKKMQSFKLGRANGSPIAATDHDQLYNDDTCQGNYNNKDLHTVFVGKSRRRYLLRSDVIDHPLFKELIERSGDDDEEDSITVGCEVVLFEHMLWMIENADPQPESLDELVEFYAC